VARIFAIMTTYRTMKPSVAIFHHSYGAGHADNAVVVDRSILFEMFFTFFVHFNAYFACSDFHR